MIWTRNWQANKSCLKDGNKDSESAVKAGFLISKIITKHLKLFTDMECFLMPDDIMFLDKEHLLSKFNLNRITISCRVEDISVDIENS